MDDAARRDADALAANLAARQYADWRELRFEPVGARVVRQALAVLAGKIARSVGEPQPALGSTAPATTGASNAT
jgi:hypothetical protein